jgi:hypothetical protein
MKKMILIGLFALAVTCFGGTENFIITCGDYSITVSPKRNYTIELIKYQGKFVTSPNSMSGVVMCAEKNLFVGSGHKEGGQEKVEEIKLLLDGKEVQPEDNKNYTVEKASLLKKSKLLNLNLECNINFSAAGIQEKIRLTGAGEQKIHLVYCFMYAMVPRADSEYLVKLENGKLLDAKVTQDETFVIKDNVKWLAVNFPSDKRTVLLYFPKVIKGKGLASTLWQRKYYTKFYTMLNIPSVIDTKYDSGDMEGYMRVFETNSTNWKEIVDAQVSALDAIAN